MKVTWRQRWGWGGALLKSLTASLLGVLIGCSSQAHQQLVHFVHHAHVSLVEKSRVVARIYSQDLGCRSNSHRIQRPLYLTRACNVTPGHACGKVQVEGDPKASWSTISVV